MPSSDIAIIGGGIVGLATAMRFAETEPSLKITLIEKEPRVGMHQTGHNSGVIHSGIYYTPGSLKAKLCVSGARRMVEFAKENNVPYEICGKLIVATEAKEIPWLRQLFERGTANGVPGLRMLTRDQIPDIEPHATGVLGLHSSSTGIIDFTAVAQAMARRLAGKGGEVKTGFRAIAAKSTEGETVIETSGGEVRAKFVINCGGLYSDEIARKMGVEPRVRIVPFRGEYCLVRDSRRSLVRHLIYPVPVPDLPFLGVHFTRTVDGKLEAGPNALLALAREGYQRNNFHAGEFSSMLGDVAFWKMIFRYWKTGIFEFYRAMSKKGFAHELQKLVPEIKEEDLVEGPSGVRAQCVDENGFLVNDFKIVEGPNSLHVLNVPSPAATSSLAIADYIISLAQKVFVSK